VTPLCEWRAEPLGIQNAHPRLSWSFSEVRDSVRQSAYQILASSRPDGAADLWDSGRVESSDAAVLYQGKPLHTHQQAYWRVRAWLSDGTSLPWSRTERWSMGPQDEADWGTSRWIGRDDLLESTQDQMPGIPGLPKEPNFFPAPHLRKDFTVRGTVRSAQLYVSGLGYAEMHLNGHKIGDTERDPGFTNYNDRVLYVTHDVTGMLHQGANALGAILGTGWYDVHDVATWHFNTASWRRRPRMRLLLALSYSDGTTEMVVSDESWRCAAGPILRDGIYTGEVYDARKELPGWCAKGFDDSAWTPALVVEAPAGKLVPLTCEPIRITEELKPVSITQPTPGVYIVDMGQNFSGHVQLRVKGPAGQTITMRYAEMLHEDGTLNSQPIDHFMEQTTPRQPFQQDTYICKGAGQEEVWEQRFSYAGFQFVEVTGFPGVPTADNFRGRFAHTDVQRAGEFACSDETMNRIQKATIWSYWSNAQSYPTDCPQREKNGWTGDAGLAAECGLTNFHSVNYYGKWLDDLADAQRPDGGLPVLVPNGGWGDGERWPGELTPPWDAAYPIIVWNLYRYTGDRRVLERHVDPLRRYIEFFLRHRRLDGLAPALGIGDWSPWKTQTPQDYITNAYLFLDLTLLSNALKALGETKTSQHYGGLAQELAAAIHKAYYNPAKHQYANGSQTAQSTALYFGFVPESERTAVLGDLVLQAEQLGHIDVGILGAKHLLRALSEGGRTDLAYRLVTQKEMPGWGYWVSRGGATTLWEGWKKGASLNHIMFGDVSAWAYQWVAGIQQEPDSIGFDKILFRPNPIGGLTSARASYAAPRGRVSSEWTVEGKRLHLVLEVPCGSSARLVLPSGSHLAETSGAHERGAYLPDGESMALSSGRHRIEALLA
jgi:alpha-L-rhamnosidase